MIKLLCPHLVLLLILLVATSPKMIGEDHPDCRIILLNKDRSHGDCLAFDLKKGLLWQQAGGSNEVYIKAQELQELHFLGKVKSNQARDRLILQNGDRLYGKVLSLTKNNLRFQTVFIGELTLPWHEVRIIEFNTKKHTLTLFHPTRLQDWSHTLNVVYKNGIIDINRSYHRMLHFSLTKYVPLADKIRIDIDFDYDSPIDFILVIGRVGGRHRLLRHHIDVLISNDVITVLNYSKIFGEVRIPGLSDGQNAKLTLFFSKKHKQIDVLFNNRFVLKAKVDFCPDVPNSICLREERKRGVRKIHNFTIRRWNGRLPNQKNEDEDTSLFLVNGDIITGKIVSINNSKLHVKSPKMGDIKVDLSRLVGLSNSSLKTPRIIHRHRNDVRLFLRDGSQVKLRLKRIYNGIIHGKNRVMGALAIKRITVEKIIFNLYDRRHRTE